MIKRALISVYDKSGILDFAKALAGRGVEILSTGGTANLLAQAGVPVKQVSEVTGFPEILGGRVKTLHPVIHAGILAIRGEPEHDRQMKELGITPIDLVAVNLYPFRDTVMKPGVKMEDVIENIDIGGPTMIRSAAKNYQDVVVLVNPADYAVVLDELRKGGEVSRATRFRLAVEAFHHTAAYDALISRYLGWTIGQGPLDFPDDLVLSYRKRQGLRYGENPHQKAAFYADALEEVLRAQLSGGAASPAPAAPAAPAASGAPAAPAALNARIAGATQVHGRELSYNNIGDTNGAIEAVKEFTAPAVVAVKHATPCGVGTGADLFEAYRKAYEGDAVSIFGGIVACNQAVGGALAREMAKIFLEVIVAPAFSEEALGVLGQKKDLRLLTLPGLGRISTPRLATAGAATGAPAFELKGVGGGLLVQSGDVTAEDPAGWAVTTKRRPTAAELTDLAFAWAVVKHVRSNAIVLAKGGATVGIGGGQTNRIDAARGAIERAGERARGAVLASDAFFPFPDVAEAAAAAGVTAMVHPGGSVRDAETIAAADKYGLAVVTTGIRHFRHS